MAVYEVAEMIAKIGADTTAFDNRLSKVEEGLHKLVEINERTLKTQERDVKDSYERQARAAQLEFDKITQAAIKLADTEYRVGHRSALDFQMFLDQKLQAYEANSVRSMEIAGRMLEVEKKVQQAITAETRAQAEIRANIIKASAVAAGGDWKAAIRNMDMHQAMKVVTNPFGQYSVAEQEAASSRIVQLSKEEAAAKAQIAKETEASQIESEKRITDATIQQIKDREVSVSNLARFEYEQGNLSAEAYKVFLQRRMADYEQYTSEWRAASTQLLGVERDMEAERVKASRDADAQILARQREIASERLAIEKEVDAMMGASYAEFVNKVGIEANKLAEKHNAATSGNSISGSMGKGLGNVAAGITAIEAGSAMLALPTDNTITGIANNTTMTTDAIKTMREETIRLHAETAQTTDDIAKGYMHAYNFVANTKDAIKELTWANKEAYATGSSTSDVTNSLASSLSIFHATADAAPGYIDVLHRAAAEGNLFIQDFVEKAGPAFALAAATKDKIYNAAAMVSVLSKHGFDAAKAATQVQSLSSHIMNPANVATKYIMALDEAYKAKNPNSNISLQHDFTQQGIQEKGMPAILRDLGTVTGGRADEIAKVIPALRGGIGGITLVQVQKELDQSAALLKQLMERNTGAETAGIAKTMDEDSLQKWKVFITELEVKFIPVGRKVTDILIAFEPAIQRTADLVLSLMNAFQKLPEPIQQAITLLGGLVIINQLTGVFTALGTSVRLASSLRVISSLTKEVAGLRAVLGAGAAAEEVTVLGGSVAALATGPVIVAVAATAALVLGIKWLVDKYNELDSTGDRLNKQWHDQIDANIKTAQAAKEHADKLNDLLSRYDQLRSKVKPTKDDIQDMHDTLNQISALEPMAVSGYNSVGNAISLVGEKALKARSRVEDLNLAVASRAKADQQAVDLAQANSGLDDKLSADRKLLAQKGFQHYTTGQPYMKVDYNDEALTGQIQSLGLSGGMGKGFTPFSPAELSKINSDIRALLAQEAANTSKANDLIKQGSSTVDQAKFGAVPNYVASMLKDLGKQVGRDCGEEISHYLGSKVSGLDNASHRVYPNAQGNYPEGTILHASPGNSSGKYQRGHYGAIHYENGIAHFIQSNVKGHDVVDDRLLSSTGMIRAATDRKGVVHAYMPSQSDIGSGGGGDGTSVNKAEVAATIARAATAKATAKQAEHLRKLREQHYQSQVLHISKLIALDNKAEDPETNNFRAGVDFDISRGQLKGISHSKANQLQYLASVEDNKAHLKYVDNIIDKAKSKAAEASAPQNVRQAISGTSIDWDKWKALGTLGKPLADGFTAAQHKLLEFAATVELSNLGLKTKKAREDAALQERLSLPENKALKMAVEAAGGTDAWKRIGTIGTGPIDTHGHNAQQEDYIADANAKIRAENDKFVRDLKVAHEKAMQEWNKEFDPTKYNPGQIAVDEWLKSTNQTLNPGNQSDADKIRKDANDKALEDASKFLALAEKQLETATLQTSHSLADLHDPVSKAVHSWEDSNQAAIALYYAMGGTEQALKTYEDHLRKLIATQAETNLKVQSQQMTDKLNADRVSQQVYNTPGDQAVAQWEASDAGKDAIATLGQYSDAVKTLEANMKSTTNAEDDMSKALARRQQIVQGLTQGVMTGIQNAFSPDPQVTGGYQTTLYDLKTQQMQYKMDQLKYNNTYGADPNDPYIQRLKDIQAKIDETQNKLNGMGNTMTNVFRRLFGGIYDTFKQTLVKMAQEYLQSQLLQYLTRQVGTGAGFNQGGGGGGGFLGVLTGVIGTVLGGMGGGKGGGGGGTTPPATFTGSPTLMANYGWAGYADNGWDVPGTQGRGDVVPAMLAPKEMVLPVPLANKVRSMADGNGSGGTTNITNNFKQVVNTPDASGFRSSKTTIFQGARSAFGGKGRR